MKTHWIKDKGLTRFSETVTHCGLVGWEDAVASHEFVNVSGDSFVAVEKLKGVTCGRCRKGANAKSN